MRRRNYTQKPMSMPETRRIAGSQRPMENRAALTMRRVRRLQEVLVERKISLLWIAVQPGFVVPSRIRNW